MCGIIGYTGRSEAMGILLRGLEALAYRGYDSAGVAIAEAGIRVVRAAGEIDHLKRKVQGEAGFYGTCGIGHTRWATHGAPTEENAHPHMDTGREVAVVHNGIIENSEELRADLMRQGVVFSSDTDTEVIPHLLAHHMRICGEPIEAIRRTMARLRGAYALGILFAARPGELYAVREKSPLVVARGADGSFIASDVSALLAHTREVCYPEEGEIIRLDSQKITVYKGDIAHGPHMTQVTWESGDVSLAGYRHYMEKEIYEAPRAARDTLASLEVGPDGLPPRELLSNIDEVCFVGCGSAYHVGLANIPLGESLTGVRVHAEIASEFRYRRVVLSPRTLVVAISQSGETADTLAAHALAKERGYPTLAIVNVEGSALARAADYVIYTKAGPEIAVATTKAYCAQLVAVWWLWAEILRSKGKVREASGLISDMEKSTARSREILAKRGEIQRLADRLTHAEHIFFIGRGTDAAVCREAALKLKEISYIHAESYEAGELKHGTISLITAGTPVIAVVTQPRTQEKMYSNIREVQSRGAQVIVATASDPPADCEVLHLSDQPPEFASLGAVLALDLLAYEVCVRRGGYADRPRNLAKSVTVE